MKTITFIFTIVLSLSLTFNDFTLTSNVDGISISSACACAHKKNNGKKIQAVVNFCIMHFDFIDPLTPQYKVDIIIYGRGRKH